MSVIDKVKKLFALAEHNDNPHEAAVAIAQAQRLIDEHKLSTRDVEQSHADDDIWLNDSTPHITGKRIPTWKRRLSRVIAAANGCALYQRKTWDGVCHLYAVGRRSDVEMFLHVFAWTTSELTRLSAHVHGDKPSWLHGAVTGIRMAIEDVRRDPVGQQAIVLATDDCEKASKKIRASLCIVKVRRDRSTSLTDQMSYLRGVKDGYELMKEKQRPSLKNNT